MALGDGAAANVGSVRAVWPPVSLSSRRPTVRSNRSLQCARLYYSSPPPPSAEWNARAQGATDNRRVCATVGTSAAMRCVIHSRTAPELQPGLWVSMQFSAPHLTSAMISGYSVILLFCYSVFTRHLPPITFSCNKSAAETSSILSSGILISNLATGASPPHVQHATV